MVSGSGRCFFGARGRLRVLERRLGQVGRDRGVGAADDRVDQAVLHGFGRAHPVVAVDVAVRCARPTARCRPRAARHAGFEAQHFARLHFDVGGSALEAGGAPGGSGCASWAGRCACLWRRRRSQAPIDGGHADARRRDRDWDQLHRVVDGQAGVEEPPGKLMYSWISRSGSSCCQVQQLRHDQVGDRVVDLRAEEDDAVAQQQRKMS